MPRPRRILPLALAALLPLGLSLACGEYPGVPRQLAGDAPAAQEPAAVSEPGLTPESQSGPTPAVSVGLGPVEITLKDFELVPAALTVQAGEVAFTLVNGGRYTHDFRIEGQGVDSKSPRVAAGRTLAWAVTLAPGEYRISCPISNHADRGMVGTLTVVAQP